MFYYLKRDECIYAIVRGLNWSSSYKVAAIAGGARRLARRRALMLMVNCMMCSLYFVNLNSVKRQDVDFSDVEKAKNRNL